MTIQETVNKTLVETRDKDVKSALRILKAEFQREKGKEVDDARAIKIIRGLIKSEDERLGHIDVFKKGGSDDKARGVKYIHILSELLPTMVGEEEVRDWVADNIDFSEFKNPMQAMKFILEHFGTSVDNKTAREVIEDVTK
jgi:uncharacterized protein YqeY